MGYKEFMKKCVPRNYHMYNIDDDTFISDYINMTIKLKCLDCGATFNISGNWNNPQKKLKK